MGLKWIWELVRTGLDDMDEEKQSWSWEKFGEINQGQARQSNGV